MEQLNEYFSPTKLSELKTRAEANQDRWGHGGIAKQQLEVYDKREALATLSTMIEELKTSVEGKVKAIQDFAEEHDLDHMVSFSTYDNPEWAIAGIMEADVESDAMQWMRSNHDC